MVNFKLGNEMWRWINQHDTSVGQRKILSPRQDSFIVFIDFFIVFIDFYCTAKQY